MSVCDKGVGGWSRGLTTITYERLNLGQKKPTANRGFFKPTANQKMETVTAINPNIIEGQTTIFVLYDVQLLLNKQQQIWGGIYIHWHLSSTDTVVLNIDSLL